MITHLYPAKPLDSRLTDNLLSNPTNGQFWYNSTNKHLYKWDGAQWVPFYNRNDYAGNSGQIEHGQYLPKPVSADGKVYDYDECVWSVSPASLPGNVDFFVCSTTSDGQVTMQYRNVGSGTMINGIANFIIIGIAGNVNGGNILPPPQQTLTPTPTPTAGATMTPTPTPGVTVTPTKSPLATPSPSISSTPGVTATRTPTPTPTRSSTPLPTPTPTRTPTPTPSQSAIPPMVVSITDPEGGTNASSLEAECNIALYSSFADSGYNGCSATSITNCALNSCAPEPGDSGLGPVMRVQVSGGVPPYTVKLKNFQPTPDTTSLSNPGFESGDTGWTKQTLTGSGAWTITTATPRQSGSYSAKFTTNNSSTGLLSNIARPVTPGQSVTASAYIWLNDETQAEGSVQLRWFNSSMIQLSVSQGNIIHSQQQQWVLSSVTGVAPSGAAYVQLTIFANSYNGSNYKQIAADSVSWSLGSDVGTPECFYVGGASVSSVPFTGVAKSYTINSSGQSTPIISINGKCGSASFLMDGTFTIEVNDSNGAVQTFNKNYSIRRFTSGGGGGGGDGGPGCVEVSMWMDTNRQAYSINIGDYVDGSAYDPIGIIPRQVRANRVIPQPCLRMVTESGISIIASTTTPMTMMDGSSKMFPEMLDEMVLVDDYGDIRWERVVELEYVGVRDVVLFNVDDQSYFAGEDGNRRIATHNINDSKMIF